MITAKAFVALPPELRLNIAEKVEDPIDLLTLATATVTKRFRRVCIALSPSCMRAFEAIADHPILRAGTEEVVYLGDKELVHNTEHSPLVGLHGSELHKILCTGLATLPNLKEATLHYGKSTSAIGGAFNKPVSQAKFKNALDWTGLKMVCDAAGFRSYAGEQTEVMVGMISLESMDDEPMTSVWRGERKRMIEDCFRNVTSLDLSFREEKPDVVV